MMKRMIIALFTLCCLQLHLVSAQPAEVTQLLLNVEKLAQLKQILSDMKKGYNIAYTGYSTVKDISQGNFSLHRVFLDGLLSVNPQLVKYRRVADIIRYQRYIVNEYRAASKRFIRGGRFSRPELDQIARIYKNLLDGSIGNLDELAIVLTASKLRMDDGERLDAIDRLYSDMEGKLLYLREFNNRTSATDTSRKKWQQEIKTLKQLYGTND